MSPGSLQTPHAAVDSLPSISVVIVNWNLAEDTLACLGSVLETGYPNLDVIVVDNGSSDNSVEQIAQVYPQVRQVVNKENMGFAAGANQGLDLALAQGCDYALVLNNDTTVAPDSLSELMAAGETDPQIGILSPHILFYDEPERTWHLAARWHRWLPIPVHVWQTREKLVEADFVSGCGMMLRRSLLEKIGTFDTTYFMYGEDIDLCLRAKRAGYRVVAVPQARIWHKVSVSADRISTKARYWQTRNQILVYRTYPPTRLRCLLPSFVLSKAAADVLRDLFSRRRALVNPTLRGVRDGLREPVDPVG